MRKTLVCLLLSLLALSAFAQGEPTVFDRYPNALGVYVDSMGVYGLTYQRWLGDFGLQVAGGASINSNTIEGAYHAAAILEGKYRLFEEDFASWFSGALYLALPLGFSVDKSPTWELTGTKDAYGYPEGQYVLGDPSYLVLAAFGIGFEMTLFRHFSFDSKFLYTATFLSETSLNFGGGASFHYRF